MAVTTVEEPVLCKIDRLEKIMKQLEEIKGGNKTPKSSCASTPSTCTSDGQVSSVDFSPRSLEKRCCPIDDVIVETETKGTLIERLVDVEDRVAKLQSEAEMNAENRRVEEAKKNVRKKKGLRQMVKSCVSRNQSKQT